MPSANENNKCTTNTQSNKRIYSATINLMCSVIVCSLCITSGCVNILLYTIDTCPV